MTARYDHSAKYADLPKSMPGVWRFSHSIGEMPLERCSPEAVKQWDQESPPNSPERKSRLKACQSLPSFSSCSTLFADRFADYNSDSDDEMTPAPGSAAEKMYAAQAGCTEGAECSDDDEDVPVADKTRSLDEFDSPLIRRKWKSFSSFAPTIKPETPPRGGLTQYAEVTQQAQETPTHLPSTRSEDGMRAKKVRKSISFAMDDEEAVFTSEVVKPPTLSPGRPPKRATSRSGLYGIRNGHTASVEIMIGCESTTSMFDEPKVAKSIVEVALSKLRDALSLYSMESLYFTNAKEFTSDDIINLATQRHSGAGAHFQTVADWIHSNETNPLTAIPVKEREEQLVAGHPSFLMRRRVVHLEYKEGAKGFGFGFTTCVEPGFPWTRVHRVPPPLDGTVARLMPGDVLVQVNGVDVLNRGPRFIGEQLADSTPTVQLLVARSPDNETTGMYMTTSPVSHQIGVVDEEIKGLYQTIPNDGAEVRIRQIVEGIERDHAKPRVSPVNAWLQEQNEAIFSLLDSMSGTLTEAENVIAEWDLQEEHHRYGPQYVDC